VEFIYEDTAGDPATAVRKAQKLVEKGDSLSEKGNYKEGLDTYKKGAEAYLDLWRTYCETPLSKGEKPKQCEKADEIVYNMAKAYQAARLLAKAISVRLNILLNKSYGLQDSPLAKKALYEIGGKFTEKTCAKTDAAEA